MHDLADQLERLRNTTDWRERHEIALQFADAREQTAVPVLVDLISRPVMLNQRGTLLYCLEHFDCTPYSGLLATILCTGDWEEAAHACIILETMPQLPFETMEYLRLALSENCEGWRHENIKGVLDLFKLS